MNWADKVILCLFLAAIITWQALHQAKLFEQNKTISHFWKAVAYAGALAIATAPFIAAFGWWYLLKIPVIGVLQRGALFDFILNKIRGKPLFYSGIESPNESQIDEIEKHLLVTPTEWWIFKVICVIAFIVAVIFIK